MSLPSIQSLLAKHGIRPKKRLGQNFLTPMPTMRKIVDALEINEDDTVVEIGPGLGLMTSLAAEQARRVIAIDRDEALLAIAQEEFGDRDNIDWIHADILKCDLKVIVHGSRFTVHGLKILGNLPYNISSPIIFWMLDARQLIDRAIIMVQKEVALRLAASPGTKDYGIPSVLLQAHADVRRLFDVSAKSFLPPPEVTSSIVCIDFRTGDDGIADEAQFRTVVKAAFGKRRKTIRNALMGNRSLGASADAIDEALAACQIDPRRRPETLTIEEYVHLAETLKT